MWSAKRGSTVAAVAVATVFMGACEQASSPVSPDASIASPNVAFVTSVPAQVPDQAVVCKDASSPGGPYTFSISATSRVGGDNLTTSATLSPGECATVYTRTTSSATFTNVMITEQIPQGASYQVNHVAVNDIDGPRNITGTPSVTVKVNQYHGATANYFNEATQPGQLPMIIPFTTTQQPGKGIVCKDGSSPVGRYTFDIQTDNTLPGDQSASSVTLDQGQCAIVYIRGTSSPAFSTVTSTEVIPSGAGYQVNHIAVNDIDGPRNVNGPTTTTTLKVNQYHGSVANYFNESTGSVTSQGTVRVCKSGAVQGTFNLTALVANSVPSDVITNEIALTAGSCANVFVRTQGGLPPAIVTVTETLAANANTFLSGVTVNGVATATVGAAVVVQQDELVGKVVVFINATANVGANVTYHPTTPTPGQVILCKSSTSPTGPFTFDVTGVATVGTDQIKSTVSLMAGECKTVFIRSTVEPVPATILVTEQVSAVALASVQVITATTNGSVSGAGGVSVAVNGGAPNTGNVLVFFNLGVNIP